MSKQPSNGLPRTLLPHALPEDFPITHGDGIWRQDDSPVDHLHHHESLEIGYCHAGSGIFIIEDKCFSYSKGDVLVVNSDEFHLAQSAGGTVSEWTFLWMDPIRLVGPATHNLDILSPVSLRGPDFENMLPDWKHPGIVALVYELVTEMKDKKANYQSTVRGLVAALMPRLHRLPGLQPDPPDPAQRPAMERIAPALYSLATRYAKPLQPDMLAKKCSLSHTQFRRLFKQAVGKSPRQYLNQLRLRMAAALLENTNRRILDISMEVGYPTLSSFNRLFKREMKASPREWRKQHPAGRSG